LGISEKVPIPLRLLVVALKALAYAGGTTPNTTGPKMGFPPPHQWKTLWPNQIRLSPGGRGRLGRSPGRV